MDHNSTLYQILGVRKSASSSRIRAAYRSKAKTAHPDVAGGNAEAFASIKRAHDVLMNPETRAHYDKTGEIRERAIDQGRIAVFTLLSSAIDEALQAAENTGVDVASEDMLTAIKKVVDLHIQQLDQKCKAFTQRKATYSKLARRFKQKKGEENVLDTIITTRLRDIDHQIANINAAIVTANDAKLTLAEYSFTREGPRWPSAASEYLRFGIGISQMGNPFTGSST